MEVRGQQRAAPPGSFCCHQMTEEFLTEEFWVIAQDTPQSCPCQGVKKLGQASTSHCLGSTAGGWMLAPRYLSYVHRVLRATESLQGKWQGWHSEAVRELCREMAHPEEHSRGSQPLAQIQTASCHLKDEMLEVSLWAEGQRTIQRLLGIGPNSYLRIDHVTLDGATSGSFPLLASRESVWLSEVPDTLAFPPGT